MGDRPSKRRKHKRECEKQEGLGDNAWERNNENGKEIRRRERAHGITKPIHLQPSYMPIHSCILWPDLWISQLPAIVCTPSSGIWGYRSLCSITQTVRKLLDSKTFGPTCFSYIEYNWIFLIILIFFCFIVVYLAVTCTSLKEIP